MADSNSSSSNKAGDDDGGDLSQWDYLTLNFDHDDIFQERSVVAKPSISDVANVVVSNTSNRTSSTLLDLEPIPYNHAGASAIAITSESNVGTSPQLYSLSNVTAGKVARTTSCLMESSLSYWRDGANICRTAPLATSNSCPTLSSSGTKRMHSESLELNCGMWNYAPDCSDTLSDFSPYQCTVTQFKPPPPPTGSIQLCKPLNVYNYFYRDERDNIVNGMKQHGDPGPPPVRDFSQAKFERLLYQRWYVRFSLTHRPACDHQRVSLYPHTPIPHSTKVYRSHQAAEVAS
jgi:hypothetical protein